MDLVLQIDVRRKPSVVNRVLAVFHRRGFHVESMSVGDVEDGCLLRMTMVVDADQRGAMQLEANLYNLIDVLRVKLIVRRSAIFREMALVRVMSTSETTSEILRVANGFHSRVLETATDSMVFEVVGGKDAIDRFLAMIKQFGILDFARMNCLALPRTGTCEAPAVRDTNPRGADWRTIA
jgi:acetolactate synthase-1/3 small subunit